MWNLIAAGFGSLVLMYVFWQEFDPRVLFVFVVLLAAAEIFIHFRWRLNIVCKHCGFDPVLYLKNPQLASEKVKAQLDIRKNNPASLLSPPLQLPKVTREKVEMAQKAEHAMAIRKKQSSLLSKQV
ncbi:MAG: hypothetical protein BroJett040_15300 [Oligoflexia bacterium]|nr:MAG: hypothetical protein BroJett040_15300 [Oligoflexia bacterium]